MCLPVIISDQHKINNMQELETSILDKINVWLNGNYDLETKNKIKSLLDSGSTSELTDSFYRKIKCNKEAQNYITYYISISR